MGRIFGVAAVRYTHFARFHTHRRRSFQDCALCLGLVSHGARGFVLLLSGAGRRVYLYVGHT